MKFTATEKATGKRFEGKIAKDFQRHVWYCIDKKQLKPVDFHRLFKDVVI